MLMPFALPPDQTGQIVPYDQEHLLPDHLSALVERGGSIILCRAKAGASALSSQ